MITKRLRFVAPSRPARTEWVAALLHPAPTLVMHDGVNEAMSLMGADDQGRRRRGHVPAPTGDPVPARRRRHPRLRPHADGSRDAGRRDAYGWVHKGNALDGARIMLENTEPFGRQMRGVSHVFVTKDRPGHLRAHGRPTKTPGKTYMGTLVVDDADVRPRLHDAVLRTPRTTTTNQPVTDLQLAELADIVHDVIAALPDHTVASVRMLFAEMRKAGHPFPDTSVRDALDDLLVAGRLIEVPGKRGAKGYRAVLTASAAASEDPLVTASATASCVCVAIESVAVDADAYDRFVDRLKQSEAVRSSRISSRHFFNQQPKGGVPMKTATIRQRGRNTAGQHMVRILWPTCDRGTGYPQTRRSPPARRRPEERPLHRHHPTERNTEMTEQPKEPMHDQLRRALPDQPELALALSESINEALTLGSTLTDVGARQDEMGQYVFDTPKVIFYDVGGDWEIDIITVEGFVGFDVPIGEVRITRRNDEAKAAMRSYRISRGWCT